MSRPLYAQVSHTRLGRSRKITLEFKDSIAQASATYLFRRLPPGKARFPWAMPSPSHYLPFPPPQQTCGRGALLFAFERKERGKGKNEGVGLRGSPLLAGVKCCTTCQMMHAQSKEAR